MYLSYLTIATDLLINKPHYKYLPKPGYSTMILIIEIDIKLLILMSFNEKFPSMP